MNVKFFNPAKEFELHMREYTETWQDVRKRGDLILRKDVEEFESNFAEYIGVKYSVGLNSGTDALFIALKAVGIKQGDRVLVPSHTFVATAQVVAQLGAKPVLYDLNHQFTGSDFANIRCLMVAHIAGEFAYDMQYIAAQAKALGIPVIEDACQALGAVQNGKKAGSFGSAGAFSFYPAKILGGPGDAGMLVTNDKKIYEFAEDYRNHWKSDYSLWGINSRLDNVLAAELSVKLKRIDKTLTRRQEVAQLYLKGLGNNKFVTLPADTKGRVWQDFVIKLGKYRNNVYDLLKDLGVETMKNEYPFPIKKLPFSLIYERRTLRLPINEIITDQEVAYVIKCINKIL